MNTLGDRDSDITAGIVARDDTPKTYVSYYGDAALDQWVEALATKLRTEDRLDATIDKWQVAPGDQEPAYLEEAIRESTFVVLICTPEYAELFNQRQKRVGYAAAIITGRVLRLDSYRKYVPVLRGGQRSEAVPAFLSDSGVIDLRGDTWNAPEYARLVKTLSQQIGNVGPGLSADDRQRTYWNDLSWHDITARSAPPIRAVRASLLDRIRILPAHLEPEEPIATGLEPPWSRFLNALTWKQECLERLETLQLTLRRLSGYTDATAIRSVVNELTAKLRPRQTYASLHAAFAPPLARRLLSPLHSVRNAVFRQQGGGDPETKTTLGQVQRQIHELMTHGERGAFRKCFLVMGGVGSGKSHFLAGVLRPFQDPFEGDPNDTPDWLPIWVDKPRYGTPFLDHLLKAVRSTTRVDWPALDTFWDVVASIRGAAKVVFILDDVHKWFDAEPDLRQVLAEAIDSLSRIDNVHWLLCLNDRAYASIATLTDRVWAPYSDEDRNLFHGHRRDRDQHPTAPRSGGWYRLDDLVEETGLGVTIVRQAADILAEEQSPSESEPEPDEDGVQANSGRDQDTSGEALLESIFGRTRSYDATTQRALANPLVASVYVVSSLPHGFNFDHVVNVRFLPFLEELRRLLVARSLGEAGSVIQNPLVLEQSIDYVARAFAERGDAELRAEELRDRIGDLAHGESALATPATLSAALQALERAHLIDLVERDSLTGITRIAWNTLRFDLFWELHLADQQLRIVRALPINPDLAVQEIDGWLDGFKAARLRNGVAQFLLLLSDAGHDPFALTLWSHALKAHGLPLHSALFAAGHATTARQKYVAHQLQRHHVVPVTSEDLIALVSFTRLADREVMPPPLAVELLHPRFAALAEYGLGDYAAFALSYAIAQARDARTLMAVVQWLEGCEQLRTADDLARLAVDRLFDLLDGDIDRLADATIDYARTPRRLSTEYELGQKLAQPKGTDRFLFRHWFFDSVCHTIVSGVQTGSYDYFWDRQWYDAVRLNVNPGIAVELEKFANFSISNRARFDARNRKALVALVHDLVKRRNPKHRHNAFFLIRHSEPVAVPGMPTVVDEQFHGDLRIIANDSRLSYLDRIVPRFFEENLGNWRQQGTRPKPRSGPRDKRR